MKVGIAVVRIKGLNGKPYPLHLFDKDYVCDIDFEANPKLNIPLHHKIALDEDNEAKAIHNYQKIQANFKKLNISDGDEVVIAFLEKDGLIFGISNMEQKRWIPTINYYQIRKFKDLYFKPEKIRVHFDALPPEKNDHDKIVVNNDIRKESDNIPTTHQIAKLQAEKRAERKKN